MEFSYWDMERLRYTTYDIVVIGAGLTGAMTALLSARAYPGKKILLASRDPYESASRRNAGFLCYGSISELSALQDVHLGVDLISARLRGMNRFRDVIGETSMELNPCGGVERFLSSHDYERCKPYVHRYNQAYHTKHPESDQMLWVAYDDRQEIEMPLECAINPATAMERLLYLCRLEGIEMVTGVSLRGYSDITDYVAVQLDKLMIRSRKVVLALNGFNTWSPTIHPVRNQVIVTQAIKHNLEDKLYHSDEGYMYYRPINDDQLLIGGARNQFLSQSNTRRIAPDDEIINYLLSYAQEHITYGKRPEIAHSWSGILAMDTEPFPKIHAYSQNVLGFTGMNGMGVALSSECAYLMKNRLGDS